jgi:hypothetical protein
MIIVKILSILSLKNENASIIVTIKIMIRKALLNQIVLMIKMANLDLFISLEVRFFTNINCYKIIILITLIIDLRYP